MTTRGTELDVESLLAPGAPSGIVEVDGPIDASAAQQQAQRLGARFVDIGGISSKAELMSAFADGLDLPGWFGHNWDALEEAMAAPQPELAGPILVVWAQPKLLDAADPAAGRVFRSIVHSAVAQRHSRGHGHLVVAVTDSPSQTERSFDLPLSAPGRVHHVAVVVRDLDAALGFYRDTLRLEVDLVMPIETDGVRIAFLPVGESSIELVEPTRKDTGVARFLENKGEGFHHVCLEVDDIAAELGRLAERGVELIDTMARKGAEGPVAFIHPRSCHGVLVELIEAPGGPAWKSLRYE